MTKRFLITEFEIDGIHTEQLGAKNQPWDNKVTETVFRAFSDYALEGEFEWFEVETVWYVFIRPYRRDLDNFRLKPILDAVTKTRRVWTDDHFPIVRNVHRSGIEASSPAEERVVVRIYGMSK